MNILWLLSKQKPRSKLLASNDKTLLDFLERLQFIRHLLSKSRTSEACIFSAMDNLDLIIFKSLNKYSEKNTRNLRLKDTAKPIFEYISSLKSEKLRSELYGRTIEQINTLSYFNLSLRTMANPGLTYPSEFISKSQLLKTINCQLKYLDCALNSYPIKADIISSKGITIIKRSAIPALEEIVNDIINCESACKMLGISAYVLSQLIEEGLIYPIELEPINRKQQLFRKSHINQFIENIIDNNKASTSAENPISLKTMMLKGYSIACLIRKCLAGEGFLWVYDGSRLDFSLHNLKISPTRSPIIQFFTVNQVAEELSTNKNVVYHLIKNGLIKSEKKSLPHTTRPQSTITADQITLFRQKWALPCDLARGSRPLTFKYHSFYKHAKSKQKVLGKYNSITVYEKSSKLEKTLKPR